MLGTQIVCERQKDVDVAGEDNCIFGRPDDAFFDAECRGIRFIVGGANVTKGAVAKCEEEEEEEEGNDEGNKGQNDGVVDDIKGEAQIWWDVFRETKGDRGATGEDGIVPEPKAMSARLDKGFVLLRAPSGSIILVGLFNPYRDECDKLSTEFVDNPGFVPPSSLRL